MDVENSAAKVESIPLGLVLSSVENPTLSPSGMAAGAAPTIPPILLEGDEPQLTHTGPGTRYATSASPETDQAQAVSDELPEAYGSGRVLLTARDPGCLYAHWDFSTEQQQRCRELSSNQYLLLRVHETKQEGPLVAELRVHPGSHHSFIFVDTRGGRYVAELGYYSPNGIWQSVATSDAAIVPGETGTMEQPVRFATLTFPVASSVKVESAMPVKIIPELEPTASALVPDASLAVARPEVPRTVLSPQQDLEFPLVQDKRMLPLNIAQPAEIAGSTSQFEPLEEEAFVPVHQAAPVRQGAKEWTSAQEQALAKLISSSLSKHSWPGSREIEELIRHQVRRAGISEAVETWENRGPEIQAGVSSQSLGQLLPTERADFWFNVNAELVVYGATEPTASVAIGGQPIRLRPDGTFSYRFALPDGSYRLPIAAISAQGDLRQAELEFARSTAYQGKVGQHPQDPELKAPEARNVS